MFNSIITTSTSTLTVNTAIICLISALVMGAIISITYMYSGRYTKSFATSLILLPALVQVVIMMVNGNLGTGVAVLGAFSLIRFRSVPGSSKDICTIFFAMAIGLATGMGYIAFAFAITIVISLIMLVLAKSTFGEKCNNEKELKITIPEDLDYTGVFDDLFAKYTKSANLESVKTTNLGSMFQLKYLVALKDLTLEKAFIDELRCRNGNLTIVCSKQQSGAGEL
ncbi:MAG: DUF4956 domain-containing protein [Lachnospiraceae bacterium]|nr:DUF4956 domain-containing protein [Lachnospiraceae bacterium]